MDTTASYEIDAVMEGGARLRRLLREKGVPGLLELLATPVRPHTGDEEVQPGDGREDSGRGDATSGDGELRRSMCELSCR